MNTTALFVSLLISLSILAVSVTITMSLSHMTKRVSRFWSTACAALSIFATGYWAMRLGGVPSRVPVDQLVRGVCGVAVTMAMWEVSYIARLWAKAPKYEPMDIADILARGGEIGLLAHLIVDKLESVAWCQKVDEKGNLGPIIAQNRHADLQFNASSPPPRDVPACSTKDMKILARLKGAVIMTMPIHYQFGPTQNLGA